MSKDLFDYEKSPNIEILWLSSSVRFGVWIILDKLNVEVSDVCLGMSSNFSFFLKFQASAKLPIFEFFAFKSYICKGISFADTTPKFSLRSFEFFMCNRLNALGGFLAVDSSFGFSEICFVGEIAVLFARLFIVYIRFDLLVRFFERFILLIREEFVSLKYP